MNSITIIVIIAVCVIAYYMLAGKSEKVEKSYNEPPRQNPNQKLMNVVKNISDKTDFNYWQDFKQRKPIQAAEIESLINRKMSEYSTIEAFEITNTMLRWSENSGLPISKLKESVLKFYQENCQGDNLHNAMNSLKEANVKEAKDFGISESHTVCHYMRAWIMEAHLNDKRQHTAKRTPSSAYLNGLENKIIEWANHGVDLISESCKPLSTEGRWEALMYCTMCLIVDKPNIYSNQSDMDILRLRCFAILLKQLPTSIDINPNELLKSRITFYAYEKQKLANNKNYSPMFIYNVFYDNPLCESPENPSNVISPFDLLLLQSVLSEVNNFYSTTKVKIQMLL